MQRCILSKNLRLLDLGRNEEPENMDATTQMPRGHFCEFGGAFWSSKADAETDQFSVYLLCFWIKSGFITEPWNRLPRLAAECPMETSTTCLDEGLCNTL